MQSAAAPFLCIDVQIDAFMADRWLLLQLQTSADLLRTPVLAQEPLDLFPSLPGDARTIGRTLPVVGEFICLIRAIALQSAVAPQLARDRALMATNYHADLGLVMSGFHQRVYLVSLLPGKLCVAHLCASLTWRLEKHAYAIAACLQPLIFKVALQLESTLGKYKRRLLIVVVVVGVALLAAYLAANNAFNRLHAAKAVRTTNAIVK